MNILLINGTMKKGSTYHIGVMLIKQIAKQNDRISTVFLPRDMPHFCVGCCNCFMKDESKCPHISDLAPITKKIDQADLIVFTSPVYVFHTTGQMKALLDHYGYRYMVHRPSARMFTKQAVCIATAAGAGMGSANRDIEDSLKFWGIGKVYTYGVAVQAIAWDEVKDKKRAQIAKQIRRLAAQIKKNGFPSYPSFQTRMLFYAMRLAQKYIGFNEVDRAYWESMGWLGKVRPWKPNPR